MVTHKDQAQVNKTDTASLTHGYGLDPAPYYCSQICFLLGLHQEAMMIREGIFPTPYTRSPQTQYSVNRTATDT